MRLRAGAHLRALPGRVLVSVVAHALRPRATIAALHRLQRRSARVALLAAAGALAAGALGAACAAAIGARSDASAPLAADAALRTVSVAPFVALVAMCLVLVFRGAGAAPDLRPSRRELGIALQRALAAALGASAGWTICSLAAAFLSGTALVAALACRGCTVASALPASAGIAVAAGVYGALAGVLGGAIRDDAAGAFLSALVFGIVGCAALRLAGMLF